MNHGTKRIIGAAALALAIMTGAGRAWAGGGTQLWATVHTKVTYASAASDGKHLFAVGSLVNPSNKGADFLIDAYDAATGNLLWRNAKDDGGDETAGWLTALNFPVFRDPIANNVVATAGGRVFVVGGGCPTGLCFPFAQLAWAMSDTAIVRAYDANAGTLLWEHVYGPGEGASQAVAATATRVYVGGPHSLRAFDAATGAPVWETPHDFQPQPIFGVSDVHQLAIGGTRLFAALGDQANGFRVRAYDAATGVVAWDHHGVIGSFTGSAQSVAYDQGRVFVGGFQESDPNNKYIDHTWVVRAFSAVTGALLWSDPVAPIAGQPGEAAAVTTANGRVYAAGFIGYEPSEQLMVRAYDQKTGAFVWDDTPTLGYESRAEAIAFCQGRTTSLDRSGHPTRVRGLVFVIGRAGLSLGNVDEYGMIRAYDPSNGTLVWSKAAGLVGAESDWVGMAVNSSKLMVAGSTYTWPNQDGIVGVYQPF